MNFFLFYSFKDREFVLFFSSHMSQLWSLNSNRCPGCRSFQFMVLLNAFATTWCTGGGTEWLTTPVSHHWAGHIWGLMSNEKEYITYLYEVGSIKTYRLNRGASIICACFRHEVGVSGQLLVPSHHLTLRSRNPGTQWVGGWVTPGGSLYPRSVQKVSNHVEYLENALHGLNVTWQPVRRDLTALPWTVTPVRDLSLGSEVPLTELA